jgi:hypothetical protein
MIYLQYLDLSKNQLSSSIPAELSNLNDLRMLNLSDNQLSESIPAGLGNLIYLWMELTTTSLGFYPDRVKQSGKSDTTTCRQPVERFPPR